MEEVLVEVMEVLVEVVEVEEEVPEVVVEVQDEVVVRMADKVVRLARLLGCCADTASHVGKKAIDSSSAPQEKY